MLTELLSIVAVGEGELDVLEVDEFAGALEEVGAVELAGAVVLPPEGATVDGLTV